MTLVGPHMNGRDLVAQFSQRTVMCGQIEMKHPRDYSTRHQIQEECPSSPVLYSGHKAFFINLVYFKKKLLTLVF